MVKKRPKSSKRSTRRPVHLGSSTELDGTTGPVLEDADQSEENLSRVDRKRRDTRARIVAATDRLIRSRPLDELTIAEITDAADVGHGTFYLHFNSKNEVVVPIMHHHAALWDEEIYEMARELEDPAEALAYSARRVIRLVVADPLWRWYLGESHVPLVDMKDALGGFGLRDIDKGLISGRFTVPALNSAISYLFGGIGNALMTAFETDDPESVIDQVIEMTLRVLGLPGDEAHEIAHRALPERERDTIEADIGA